MLLKGKVAVVTGAGSGIGAAIARLFASEGAKVVLGDLAESARTLADELSAAGFEAAFQRVDVTNEASVAALIESASARFGRLDILVANAGGPPPGRAFEVTDEQIATALNANLTTSVRLVREALPHLQAQGWGRVCLITSYSVKQPLPGLALSNLARTGLWAWAKTAAQDVAGTGITINLACPGAHATDRMKQLGGGDVSSMGDPGDFGRVVAFLCSEPAGYVNGVALQVDGGAVLGLL